MTLDKILLTKQLEIIKNLPPGRTHPFTIEGASVLEAFVNARQKRSDINPPEKSLHRKINTVLGLWHQKNPNSLKKPVGKSNEPRNQVILRNAIEKVQTKRFSDITEEDYKLLHATHSILSKRNETGNAPNAYLSDLLSKTIASLQKHKGQITEVNDQSLFDTQDPIGDIAPTKKIVHDLMADDIFDDIQVTSMNMVDEIELELTARVFEFTGDTVISGDIPKDVLLRVIEGGLTVNGFVTGYVVAEDDITIHGNIQGGGAISNSGSIVVERSLMNAILIAKFGSITCEHLEAPRTCFAWDTVTVNGPCLGGNINAGHITIKGKAMAATLQSCGHINVDILEISQRAPTVILLAKTIDCALYNREMDANLMGHLRQVNESTKALEKAQVMDSFTHHMIHTAYRTGLFYLFGGVDSATNAIELQGRQTKALYLSQLIGFAEEYVSFFTEAYENPEEFDENAINDFAKAGSESFALVRDDIAAIPEDFGSTHRQYLQDRCGEYVFMTQRLKREYGMDDDTTFLENDCKALLKKWRTIMKETQQQAQRLTDSFGLDKDLLARMEHEPETLETLLDSTIADILASPKNDDVQRGRSPLIRLLTSTADRLKRSIEINHKKIMECRHEIKQARKELLEKRAVIFRDPVPGACSVIANHYASEVIITASKLSRRGRDTNMAKVIVLTKPITKKTAFHLWENMVQRQA